MGENGGTAFSGVERRWAPRYAFDAPVEIEWGSSIIQGQVRDISRTGMFIAPSESLWIGARFIARIVLEAPISVECTVKRVEPGRGIGVQMEVTMVASRAIFDDLIARLESV